MKIARNDPCWCGSGKKYKKCHAIQDDKVLLYKTRGHIVPTHDLLKTREQIEGIKESAKINIAVLDYVSDHIAEGICTEEIDRMVYNLTTEMGGIPAPLHYEGFPKSVCTSVNSQVCHGIPSKDVILREGDIVNVDVSTIYNGYFSDSSRMFCIGQISEEKRKLVEAAKKSLEVGLEQVKPWNFLGDMGSAVNEFVKSQGYSVVREIGGHGVGLEFHEEPWVSYVSKPGTEMLLVPGLVFTIEPMINLGGCEVYQDQEDGWTIYTKDGTPSAQWEIMVAVTEDGSEILAY